MKQRHNPRKGSIKEEPSVSEPTFDWRLLMNGNHLGFLSILISIVTVLYSAGWIPGIAKQTDVSRLDEKLLAITSSMDRLGKEFADTRVEIVRAATTIARIEGKLEAPRERPSAKPKPSPKPTKKGIFN